MLDKLAAVEARYSQIEARLAAPETYDDPAQVARLNKEQNELSPVVETYRAYLRACLSPKTPTTTRTLSWRSAAAPAATRPPSSPTPSTACTPCTPRAAAGRRKWPA